MRIFITGANGLLGANLVNVLSKEHYVYAVLEESPILNFSSNKNIFTIYKDLSNFETIDLPKDIDLIYFLAQSNRFRDFPNGVSDMLKVNIEAPLKIAKWAIENNVKKFIYASSGGVYRKPDKPVKEFFDINANERNGFYLDSKLSAEILLKNFASMFETFIIARPFFIYGKKQKKHMLIPRLINNIMESRDIVLSSQDGIKINPIHVEDAAKVFSNMINLKGEFIINVAGKEVFSLRELSEIIGEKLNTSPKFEIKKSLQNDLIADISLMTDKLYTPKISFKSGLKDLTSV
mgnify:CR=1 FL=1|jgi:UDP-glucose 4-epimerase